jgi:hypothetical protein
LDITQNLDNKYQGFTWAGADLVISFPNEIPIAGFVVVPTEQSVAEYYMIEMADGINFFSMTGYPTIDLYNEFGEVLAQSVNFRYPGDELTTNRYIHKLGVFTSCNSYDASTWTFEGLTESEDCSYDATVNEWICVGVYDLAENGGVYFQAYPLIVMD